MRSCTFFKCVVNNHFTTYILPHSPTLQHHFEPSLTHTMPFLPIWKTNEGASKSKDAWASAKNTNNSMSKLCKYCIYEESYYKPKLLYIAKKKTQTKTPPSFPCTCDTHMWRKESRVDRFLKHKIYNSTLSTTILHTWVQTLHPIWGEILMYKNKS